MGSMLRLTATLAAVAAVAACALALTYDKTKDQIKAQKQAIEAQALTGVFRQGFARAEPATVTLADGSSISYTRVFRRAEDTMPAYYAIIGKGMGYNASVPLELLVGFTNPEAADVPEQAGKQGLVVIGWKVIRSEETPGLGEKIKEAKPAATWSEGGLFASVEPEFDDRTDFQKQFSGRSIEELRLKKDGDPAGLDAITAATITSRGVVAAIQDASDKIRAGLGVGPGQRNALVPSQLE